MKIKILFTLFLFCSFRANSALKVENRPNAIDSTILSSVNLNASQQEDSVKLAKKYKKNVRIKRGLYKVLTVITGLFTILAVLGGEGAPILIGGGFTLLFWWMSRKKKWLKSNEEIQEYYKQRQGDKKYNDRWPIVFCLGLVNMILMAVIVQTGEVIFGLAFVSLLLLSLMFFYRGFWGDYKDAKQKIKKLFPAILGIFLAFLPYLYFAITLAGRRF